MPNKPWSKLNPLDALIRRTLRLGMDDGTFLHIEYIYGFEKFNTRPYHNYETWAGGYRVTDERHKIMVEREDLDDALEAWALRVKKLESSPSVVAVDPDAGTSTD
jgi:hypothetical protein